MDIAQLDSRKARARAWFEALRDNICAALEALEDEAPARHYGPTPGRFVRTAWSRTDPTGARPISGLPEIGNSSAGAAKADPGGGGGGVMGMMHGRLFEKVGVHV